MVWSIQGQIEKACDDYLFPIYHKLFDLQEKYYVLGMIPACAGVALGTITALGALFASVLLGGSALCISPFNFRLTDDCLKGSKALAELSLISVVIVFLSFLNIAMWGCGVPLIQYCDNEFASL